MEHLCNIFEASFVFLLVLSGAVAACAELFYTLGC